MDKCKRVKVVSVFPTTQKDLERLEDLTKKQMEDIICRIDTVWNAKFKFGTIDIVEDNDELFSVEFFNKKIKQFYYTGAKTNGNKFVVKNIDGSYWEFYAYEETTVQALLN
jgi:hypothetical protein